MTNTTTNLLTAGEAAQYLRLHVKSIYRLAREGKIPGRKIGGSWRFHQESLEQWLTTEKDASSLLLLEGET
jgi:excisionase family DNA binding protein